MKTYLSFFQIDDQTELFQPLYSSDYIPQNLEEQTH